MNKGAILSLSSRMRISVWKALHSLVFLANAGIQLTKNSSKRTIALGDVEHYNRNDLFEELFIRWIPAFARKTMVLGVFAIFIILCAAGQGLADPAEPAVIRPGFISNIDDHTHEEGELQKSFANQQPRLEYFLQEVTNFIDADASNFFYDYINPEVPEQAFIASRFNIYKKMLLLKDIEKSPRQRAASHDISKFMATNYKTQRIPSYAYINNPQLPEPLYKSQLVKDAFKAIKDGNIDALHALVNNYDLLDSKDKAGNELLAAALIFKKNNMVKFLVSKGSNINATNKFGITPCMIAAKTGNLEAADFLARQNCDLKKLDSQGLSALDYAKESKNVSLYFLLKNKLAAKRKR